MSLILDLLTPLLSYFHRQYRQAKASYAGYERINDPDCVLPLEKLPTEITLMIVSHLDPVSQVCLKKACRSFWPNIPVPNRELSPYERALIRSFIMHDQSILIHHRMDSQIYGPSLLESGNGTNARNHHNSHQPCAWPSTHPPRRICTEPRAVCYIDVQLREIEIKQREIHTQLLAQARRLHEASAHMAATDARQLEPRIVTWIEQS